MRLTLAAVALLAALAALAARAAAPPKLWDDRPSEQEVQDVVFFADSRPVLLRLRIRVDGKPFLAAYDDFVGEVFRYLDANGDGELSPEEAENLPPAGVFLNPNAFAFAAGGRGGPAGAKARPGEKLTREKLGEFYRGQGLTPLLIGTNNSAVIVAPGRGAAPTGSDALDQRLFALLDADGDGKLSRAELAAAPRLLEKYDADDDETLTAAEILPRNDNGGINNVFYAQVNGNLVASPYFHLVSAGPSDKVLAGKLLAKYAEGVKSPSRAQVGLTAEEFAALDANRDGKLDADELARFGARPVDLELGIRLTKGGGCAVTLLAPGGRKSPLAGTVRPQPGGELRIEMGNLRLDLGGQRETAVVQFNGNRRAQYLAQFNAADTEGKGYLDEKKAAPTVFRNSFKAMDRDRDGKLTLKEVLAYSDAMDRLTAAADAACVSMSVTDLGRGLFSLADRNGDGRLGLRELRAMVKLLDTLDRDRDGKLSADEIPHGLRVECRRGQSVGYALRMNGGVNTILPRRVPPTGPLWFQKMDLNGNGDVSRREFLGSDEEFARLDADGDGLISLEEALAAEKARRK